MLITNFIYYYVVSFVHCSLFTLFWAAIVINFHFMLNTHEYIEHWASATTRTLPNRFHCSRTIVFFFFLKSWFLLAFEFWGKKTNERSNRNLDQFARHRNHFHFHNKFGFMFLLPQATLYTHENGENEAIFKKDIFFFAIDAKCL